ncbi:formate dehydrogenase subunit alpha [Methylonatrum kenyense]|uniref:formate dehydrogenase subunit alpha n=1 Tax=Methylonatrum kenyense TaxID=455253 RepID=UPI0031F5580B
MRKIPGSTAETRKAVGFKGVDSLCPYCGVGCALTYRVDGEQTQILDVTGRDGAANSGRLCVKGRYGYDYAMHAQRLTKPLIRREESYPKTALSADVKGERGGKRKAGGIVDYDDVMPHFREATWEEALELVGRKLAGIRDTHGGDALAGFGSAKGSNEEAYLFQKLVRTGFRTNNVDHCTRLCHASSVAALLEGVGSGAVTNVVRDIENADTALLAGCNPTDNHPVAATFIKEAAEKGTKLVIVNTRRPRLADHAAIYLQIHPGTDVALFNGIMHVLIKEDLLDHDFIEQRTEGFDEIRETVEEYTPEVVANLCGVDKDALIEAARLLGADHRSMFFWGMGISQHTHGTDNSRCIIAMAMITGNVGKPGTGLHPLRGQNNVQGASDAGLIPMVYPDYQPVDDPEIQKKFEAYWNTELSPNPGLTVTEIMSGALDGSIKGMYVQGENPFVSDPDTNKVRKGLMALDFLVVQDIFMTETAEFADVILPGSSFMEKLGTYTNTDRRVQIGRPALALPGDARQDWELICEIGKRMGADMAYHSVSEVFDEFVACTTEYQNLSHEVLGRDGKWYPCHDPANSEGERIVFSESFPRPNGKARLVAARQSPPHEKTDAEYPLVLNTGRMLEHWHTGSMTRRSTALHTISPEAFVEINPNDAVSLHVTDGQMVEVRSRRGTIQLKAQLMDRVAEGSVFIPMHFREACANVLTDPAVDPQGKIPSFKYSAVSIVPLSDEARRAGSGS